MMDENKLKRQQQAVQKAISNDQYSIFEFVTGTGKTYTALLYYWEMEDRVNTLDVVVPTNYLKNKWEQELKQHSIKGSVYTIASYLKGARNPDMLIVDEIHNCAGENAVLFPKVLETTATYALGLSATLDSDQKSFLKTKNWIVADRIELAEAINESYIPDYKIYNVYLDLNNRELKRYQEVDRQYNRAFRFFGYDFDTIKRCLSSQQSCEDYLRSLGNQGDGVSVNQVYGYAVQVMNAIRARKDIVQRCEAKQEVISRINDIHNDKGIVFGQTNAFANTLEDYLDDAVAYHSNHSKLQKERRFEKFMTDKKINLLITSRIFNEGVDLPEFKLGIIASYNSNARELVQRVGRLLRGESPVIYVLCARDTQEVKWLRKSQKKLPASKIHEINADEL
jgi:superfamily II DNA or RNA helicase